MGSELADDVKFNANGREPAGRAFTMAEILLSLTIIGVVAAITLPSLTGNINERTWNTQRKALYARFSQAIALMPALNGYGTYTAGTDSASAVDTAAETFVTEGLSKVLKINNICDSEHLQDCGIVSSYTTVGGNTKPIPTNLEELNRRFVHGWDNGDGTSTTNPQKDINTRAAGFETQNGESILVLYNPYCVGNDVKSWDFIQPMMCANFIYDLNGNKGPNTVGKDIGVMTALFSSDSIVVAPVPLVTNVGSAKYQDAGVLCRNQDSDSRVPNREELMSIFYNSTLFDMVGDNNAYDNIWSSSNDSVENAWTVNFNLARTYKLQKTYSVSVRCIKR